jgi:hypothetical protein
MEAALAAASVARRISLLDSSIYAEFMHKAAMTLSIASMIAESTMIEPARSGKLRFIGYL